jgi:hypothetical protein
MKPRLFIGSSSENLEVAYAVQENLEAVAEVTVWTQGVFNPSKYNLESLADALFETDFGVFVFAPNDVTSMRGQERATVRDNVVFELGMFVGRLGRERCFILVPRAERQTYTCPAISLVFRLRPMSQIELMGMFVLHWGQHAPRYLGLSLNWVKGIFQQSQLSRGLLQSSRCKCKPLISLRRSGSY